MPEDGAPGKLTAKLVVLGVVWIALARLLASYGVWLLPDPWIRTLGLQGYLGFVLLVATALGLLLSRVVVGNANQLGIVRPSGVALAAATLVAPIVLVLSAYLAFRIALPTLIAEIQAGGRQAAERHTGAFGRSLVQSPPSLTLAWGVLLAPVAEELIFRGPLYTGLQRLTGHRSNEQRETWLRATGLARAAEEATTWLRRDGLAIVATTAAFTWMHADQEGGAGIVRMAQAACLGLSLGIVRGATGSVLPPMALHALFNLLSLAKLRRWIVSPMWPPPLPVPVWWWQAAAGCALALALVGLHRWPRLRRMSLEQSLYLARSPAEVDDRPPAFDPPPRWLVADDEMSLRVDAEGDGAGVELILEWQLTSALLRPWAARLARRRLASWRRALESQH